MDAPNPSSLPTEASRAPLHIGAVGIVARNLGRLTDYYRELLGLAVLAQTPEAVTLGAGGVPLLELTQRPEALPDDAREAGLYHTAFLMPTRADLARWIVFAARSRIPISGASDHDVSEAIYLDDPEGNGVEIYSDRPRARWKIDGATIFQKTEMLDIDAIVGEIDPATASYDAAPDGLRVGHIHLRVGDIAAAEAFYCGVLGLTVTRRRGGATFVSTGGYHHHIAFNTWHSGHAGPRDRRRAGLDWFELECNAQAELDALRQRLDTTGVTVQAADGGFEAADPWGTRIRFTLAG